MNKVIKLIILIIISSSVYFIYQKTNDNIINVTTIGDGLSLGINPYGIKDYGYIDYYKDYLTKNHKVIVTDTFSKKDLSISTLLEQTKNNPNIKKTLTEADFLILTVGNNDLIYKLSILDNKTEKNLNKIIEDISKEYHLLLKEIRKYYKRDIIVIGYYASNKSDYYLNKGIKKLNTVLSSPEEVTYIDTYWLLSNRKKYFSNPNINYPNRQGYEEISNKIIIKTLEKE